MGLDMELSGSIELNGMTYDLFVCGWGKSNQIFKWFDRNVCDGKIESGACYEVTPDQVRKLMEDCRSVIEDNSRAPELLPTEDGGGLLGGYGYDRFYTWDLEYTYKSLSEFVAECGDLFPLVRFEFVADW